MTVGEPSPRITGIHHLNFLVRDLAGAIERYRRLLDREPIVEALPGRGVETARFRVGDIWLILVQPTGPGAPAQHLEEHGEGLFLISYGTDDLDRALAELEGRGLARHGPVREGLDGWRVQDLEDTEPNGETWITQLAEGRPTHPRINSRSHQTRYRS